MESTNSVPKLEAKRILDPDTGAADTLYYWDGRLAPKVQINGILVDKLSGYTLIKKDLDNALSWIRTAEKLASESSEPTDSGHFHAKDREIFDLVKAYFVASLTFYGKCFTEAAGRHAQVSRDWIAEQEYRKLHDYIMTYRHNFAAHSGDECLELARTFVLVHPNRKILIPYLPTMRVQPDIALTQQGELGFGDLIEYVAKKVVEKYNKLANKIVSEFILPSGFEFWIRAANSNEPVKLEVPEKNKT